jgi:hypothetical protein
MNADGLIIRADPRDSRQGFGRENETEAGARPAAFQAAARKTNRAAD